MFLLFILSPQKIEMVLFLNTLYHLSICNMSVEIYNFKWKPVGDASRDEKIRMLVTHISWMAHHKQLVMICPDAEETDRRFEHNDELYFNSFHEIVTIIKTFCPDDRFAVLSEVFSESRSIYPHCTEWLEYVQVDHFIADESVEPTWPFWPTEFLYIAGLDKLMSENIKFTVQFYRSDPLLYYGRCPCKQCGLDWSAEKSRRDAKPRIVCLTPVIVSGKKYLKERDCDDVYDAFTHQYIGKWASICNTGRRLSIENQ